MSGPALSAAIVVAALFGLIVIAWAALRAWHEWLELQRIALDGRHGEPGRPGSPGARIELADLRERVRRLEAIAAGVDL